MPLLIASVACVGFLMLYSVAGGDLDPWASRQMVRFGAGMALMFGVAMIHIRYWRTLAPLSYLGSLALLVAVEVAGETGMGATRWIDLGPLQLQPSELMKIAVVLALARYYDWLGEIQVHVWLKAQPMYFELDGALREARLTGRVDGTLEALRASGRWSGG